MKRIVASILAAGALVSVLGVKAANAEEVRTFPGQQVSERYRVTDHDRARDYGRDRRDEWRRHEWRELQRERTAFYQRWNGNRYQRARFERWYHERCEQLGY